jgi:hypothetical protein
VSRTENQRRQVTFTIPLPEDTKVEIIQKWRDYRVWGVPTIRLEDDDHIHATFEERG